MNGRRSPSTAIPPALRVIPSGLPRRSLGEGGRDPGRGSVAVAGSASTAVPLSRGSLGMTVGSFSGVSGTGRQQPGAGVNPSALHSSLPTPWCTKKRPSGSYFFLIAWSLGWFVPQYSRCQAGLKKLLSET
jgi:hypothetical protein